MSKQVRFIPSATAPAAPPQDQSHAESAGQDVRPPASFPGSSREESPACKRAGA
jgi:hypothetical protein